MTSFIVQHPLFRSFSELTQTHRPLDLILADHYRHQLLAQELVDLSESLDQEDVCEDAHLIHTYLISGLTEHEAFEEHDLVPILKRRCKHSDNADNLLAILIWDHFVDKDNVEVVNLSLARLARGEKLRDVEGFQANVRRFAARMKQHTLWENKVIVPLARKRLSPVDLAELGERAADRRRQSLWPSLHSDMADGLFRANSRTH